MKTINKKAFTLAEVLITLAIIGVIAAISVPSLIQKTNQAELITAWKKNYATLNQAIDHLAFDNGGNIMQYKSSGSSFITALSPYLKIVKQANRIYSHEQMVNTYTDLAGNYLSLNTVKLFDDGQMILNNGAIVYIENCPTCGANLILWVDVNGEKKPNTLGKDLFGMEVINDLLVPIGQGTGTLIDCDCSTNTCSRNIGTYNTVIFTGAGCSSQYLYKTNN